jgi:hypothetical protein
VVGVVALLAGVAGATGAAVLAGTRSAAAGAAVQEIPAKYLPQFTAEGKLERPEGWEGWVLAGTSMGLTYNEPRNAPGPGEPPGMFLNVYIQPWAYERFLDEGEFPEGTMFILSMSEPVRKADPARGGFYQGPIELMEVHLKQEGLHESGWAFYGFGSGEPAVDKFPDTAPCYSCHADHGDYDNAFVQFYPMIRERLGMEPPPEGRASGEEETPGSEAG